MSYGITHKDHNKALSIIEKSTKYENTTFMFFDNSKVYLKEMSTRLLVNPPKYLKELEERVDALVQYAKVYGLCEMMITITTRKEDSIDDAYAKISKIWRDITKMSAWCKIQSGKRIFFRIVEPQKSGVPHFHVIVWIPEDAVETFLDTLFKKYSIPEIHVMSKFIPQTYVLQKKNHENKSTYTKSGNKIVKINDTMVTYILKNIEEISKNIGEEKLDDLSVWYILLKSKKDKKIFSMTIGLFAPIDIYRKIKKYYSLFDLTVAIKNKAINIFQSKNKIVMIMNHKEIVWARKYRETYSDDTQDSMITRTKKKYLRPEYFRNNETKKNVLVSGTLKQKITNGGYSCFEISTNTSFDHQRKMNLYENNASLTDNNNQEIIERIDALEKSLLLDNEKNKDELIDEIHIPRNKKEQDHSQKKYITVKEMEQMYNINEGSQKSYRNRIKDPLPYFQFNGNGGKITYKVSDVEEWIERKRIK